MTSVSPTFDETKQDIPETKQDLPEGYSLPNDSPPPSYNAAADDDVKEEEEDEDDPWALTEWKHEGPNWSEMSNKDRAIRVVVNICKGVAVLTFLYLFICSLDLLGASFQLLGGRTAGAAFTNSELLNNPICGLMIGVGVTVLLQSSSTSTSIIVTMVSAGLVPVENAIYMIMGANIGTSVTNTIVAMGQVANKNEFRRAFGGATVHDMFNWLCVAVFLPIEAITGYLDKLTELMVENINPNLDTEEPQFLKVITKPLTDSIIRIDKNVLTYVAEEKPEQKRPLARYWCKEVNIQYNEEYALGEMNDTAYDLIASKENLWTKDLVISNVTENITDPYTSFTWKDVLQANSTSCDGQHWFFGVGTDGYMSETVAGLLLFFFSIFVLCACLIGMVKILSSLMQGPVSTIIRKTINADFPGIFKPLTGYVTILVGAGLTILVQSSSVFTSAITPLVGLGVITIERTYPLTLGSNIGTTITSMLAALAGEPEGFKNAVQIAFVHLFFNISGILLWYPIPVLRRVPIRAAKFLGNTTADYRWFALAYLVVVFFILPALVFALSIPGWYVLLSVMLPCIILVIFIIVVNISQSRCPGCLPSWLQTWEFLPLPLRSLEPWDRWLKKCCICCRCLTICQIENEEDKAVAVNSHGEVQSKADLSEKAENGDCVVTVVDVDKGTGEDNKAYEQETETSEL